MMNKKTIFNIMASLFLLIGFVPYMSSQIHASEEERSVTFILSDELISAEYRMAGCTSSSLQCHYNGSTVIGVEHKLTGNQRVSGYPAVNNGINWQPLDVEFRVNGEVVSQPVYSDKDGQYHPKPLDFFKHWEDGTTFVAYFRKVKVNYYDGTNLLYSEEVISGSDAAGYTPDTKENEDTYYTFQTWTDELGNAIDLTKIQLTINAYAKYDETAKFRTSFVSEGNELHHTYVLDGSTAIYTAIPQKSDIFSEDENYTYHTIYTFDYWSVHGKKIDPANYPIHQDTVFEAVFREEKRAEKKTVMDPLPPSPAQPPNPATPQDSIPTESQREAVLPSVSIAFMQPVPNQDTAEITNITPVLETTEEQLEKSDVTTIEDTETPLAKPKETASWSLLNFLCMMITILLSIYIVLHKNENDQIFNKALTIITFIISAAIFFATQDLTGTMQMFDSWSFIMFSILGFQCFLTLHTKKKTKEA